MSADSPWTAPEAPAPAGHTKSGCPVAPLPPERHLRRIGRSASMRTLLIWIVLIAGFVTVYQVDVLREIAWVAPAVVAGIVVLTLLLRVQKTKALNETNNHALAHLNAGELERASTAFDRLAEAAGGNALHKLVAIYNLAFTELRRGNFDRALSLFAVLETKQSSQYRGSFAQSSAAFQSIIYGLLGDTKAAHCWLKEADTRQGDANSAGFLVLAEAIMDCRRGQYAQAERVLDERWQTATSTLSGNLLGALRLVRALAMKELTSDPEDVRDMIAGAKPFRRSEYIYLTRAWPQMDDFIAPHARA